MESRLSEKQVVQIWQQQLRRERNLVDTEGRSLEVLYGGRPNDGRGGDFRDAVIRGESGPKKGCIEIHRRARHWQEHGHHLDPAYNGVILHVVGQDGGATPAVLQNGEVAPTVILADAMTEADNKRGGFPCSGLGRQPDPRALVACLEEAGDARLHLRVSRFAADMDQTAAAQVLFGGMAEALGYSKNKLPFRELAAAVPLTLITRLISPSAGRADRTVRLTACLLGHAGLLPSQRHLVVRGEPYITCLEETWSRLGSSPALDWRLWELYKVRPANLPVRRIVALAHLLARYPPSIWPQVFLRGLKRCAGQTAVRLTASLIVAAPFYWSRQADFGRRLGSPCPVLLGWDRAAALAVNIIIPFAVAWSQRENHPALAELARGVYRLQPKLAFNSVEKHMLVQLALDPHRITSARSQQGLLHIYQTLCTQGKCRACALGKLNCPPPAALLSVRPAVADRLT